jgi:cation:H+ antiporter
MPPSLYLWFIDEAVLKDLFAGLPAYGLLLIILACIVVLSKGADWMIDGVVQLAQRTGLPKIVIGATVVSLGTTMPEAFVSVMAAFMGNSGLALGNGVGSIIADTGLILGITCMLVAVPIDRFILNRMGWIQVVSATLLVLIAVVILVATPGTPRLPRGVGIFFLVLLAGYMYLSYIWAKQGNAESLMQETGMTAALQPVWLCWGMLAGGLTLVVLSARVLVPAAAQTALRIGVPEDVIAATMVALGTSLPELTTAIVSVRKGHPEITLGNVIGADVLNCLFVIGAAATARPLDIPANFYYFHFPAMLIILYSFRSFIAFNRKPVFQRWQGAVLLGIYVVYIATQYIFAA